MTLAGEIGWAAIEVRADVVHRHEFHRLLAQHLRAIERALVEQHAREARVVHYGCGQAMAARLPFDWLGRLGVLEDQAFLVRGEGLRETTHLVRGDGKGRVIHAQRFGDALLDELPERHSGHHFDQASEHIGRMAVPPGRARFVAQRLLAQQRDELLVGDIELADLVVDVHLLQRTPTRKGLEERVAEARGMDQQVQHTNGIFGRMGLDL